METMIIKNGTVVSGGEIFRADVVIKDGKVDSLIMPGEEVQLPEGVRVIDAQGKYVSSGFVDLHVHGGAGADFMDGDYVSYKTALDLHTSHGTTLIFPTTLSSTEDSVRDAVMKYRKIKEFGIKGAVMGGLHLEGPYFAYSKKGAQDPRCLRNPNPNEYMTLLELAEGNIARWSLAPELPGALEMAEAHKGSGVLMSMGHTDATFEECEAAFEAGFTHMTHFFSCMSSIKKAGVERSSGVVEYGYFNDDVTVEIIGDGVHVPMSLIRLIYKIKGPEKIALITDALSAAGYTEGEYILGSEAEGVKIVVEDGVAKLYDRSALAGSVATMDMIVRTVWKQAGIPLEDVIMSATESPARIMGFGETKGLVKAGYDADIIVFDEDVNVSDVIVGGEVMSWS